MANVTYRDKTFTEDEAMLISTLRAERWGLLVMFEELQKVNSPAAKKKAGKTWRRIETINRNLYKLTENAVYIS
jgi:hypothetical protein